MDLFSGKPKQLKKSVQNGEWHAEYLLLSSEPIVVDPIPISTSLLRYRNRYLAKRQVMRTIRRLRSTH